jgi:hypothetical protein
MMDKIGAQIVDLTGSVTHGARDDVALSLNNNFSPSSTAGYAIGFEFGRGGGNLPVRTNGTLIYAQDAGGSFTVANGIDFHLGSATGNWFQFGSVASLSGAGALNVASYSVAGTAGVTCSGAPTASFASTNGIVTHC